MHGSSTEPLLRVSHLTKRYASDLHRSLGYALQDIGRELLARPAPKAPRPGEFAALDDLSFELWPGEALAVMGANGAGKSTLLKVLHGLVKPDGGEVLIRGRVGALIELGTGFAPVLTGRENIAINGSVMGLQEDELAAATDEIIRFAELEDAIDKPVRFYSSGMRARLAFAVAAHLRTDLLLVDEVLAVGDFSFQRKCVEHMREHLHRGGALILVSHNAFLAQTVCPRGIVLERGRCSFAGSSVEAVSRYLAATQRALGPEPVDVAAVAEPLGAPPADEPAVIDAVRATGPDGRPPATGEDLQVTLAYRCRVRAEAEWGFSVWTGDHWVCVTGGSDERPRRIEGAGELTCTVPRVPLLPGTYALRGFLIDSETKQPLALFGYGDGHPPGVFVVSQAPDRRLNGMIAQTQLVTIDVDWD